MKEYPNIDRYMKFHDLFISKRIDGSDNTLKYHLYTEAAFGATSGIDNEMYDDTLSGIMDKLEEQLYNKWYK